MARQSWWLALGVAATFALRVLPACDSDAAVPEPMVDAGADAPLEAGPDSGPLPGACPPGQLELPSGDCQPAGIPPAVCGEGFVPTDDGGCEAVLPPSDCPPGQMAIPGETACRDVAPCGAGTWGDIPVDNTTQYVDQAYPGPVSDGSAAQPWTTIQEAVDAADDGALIAIAAGSYLEAVFVLDKQVRLWGKCPAEVEVTTNSPPFASLYFRRASGSEVHGLALSTVGAFEGIVINDSVDVLVDRVWIHDTGDSGIAVFSANQPTSVRVTRSLVEWTGSDGVYVWAGAELTVEECVVRDSQSDFDPLWGRGMEALGNPQYPSRTSLTVRRCLIERNHRAGVEAKSADLRIEDTLIRDTLPAIDDQADGNGLVVTVQEGDEELSQLVLERSVIERSYSCGAYVHNARATIEAVVLRNTQPSAADDSNGCGLAIVNELPASADRPLIAIRSSVIEHNYLFGLALAAVDATLEGVIVRDTSPETSSGQFGRGVTVELNPNTDVPTDLVMSGSVIEQSHEVGLVLIGSQATLETTIVRDTRPRPTDGRFGRGLIVQLSSDTGASAHLTMRHGLIEDSTEAGIHFAGADGEVQDTIVQRTVAQPDAQRYGDGVISATLPHQNEVRGSSVSLDRCLLQESARAALTSFGASVTLAGTRLECNGIDLNGEEHFGQPFVISDLGDNSCGCGELTQDCRVLSSGLSPPDPI